LFALLSIKTLVLSTTVTSTTAQSIYSSRFFDFSVGLILHHDSVLHDFVLFLYNRIMGTESFVFEIFLLHCITARHVEGGACLSPGARRTDELPAKISKPRKLCIRLWQDACSTFICRKGTQRTKKNSRVIGDVLVSIRG